MRIGVGALLASCTLSRASQQQDLFESNTRKGQQATVHGLLASQAVLEHEDGVFLLSVSEPDTNIRGLAVTPTPTSNTGPTSAPTTSAPTACGTIIGCQLDTTCACTGCDTGYTYISTVKKCCKNVSHCNKYSSSTCACTGCKSPYLLAKGKCATTAPPTASPTSAPTATPTSAPTASPSSGCPPITGCQLDSTTCACIGCDTGYTYLSTVKKCCNNVSRCNQYSTSTCACTGCKSPYLLANGKCATTSPPTASPTSSPTASPTSSPTASPTPPSAPTAPPTSPVCPFNCVHVNRNRQLQDLRSIKDASSTTEASGVRTATSAQPNRSHAISAYDTDGRRLSNNFSCCGLGYYSDGIFTCLQCGPGTYNNFNPNCNSFCSHCEAGQYQPNAGATQCLDCQPGFYSSDTYSKYCTQCPPNTWSGLRASGCSAQQYKCNSGYITTISLRSGDGLDYVTGFTCSSSAPVDVKIGNSGGGAAHDGIPGPFIGFSSGLYLDKGSSSGVLFHHKDTAPTDTYGTNVNAGSVTQLLCPNGQYLSGFDVRGVNNNQLALLGSYAICADGYTPVVMPTPCPAGTSGALTPNCTPCATGSYSGTAGSLFCFQCALGFYAGSTGSSSCTPCAPGSVSLLGQSSCTTCSAGTYSTGTFCLQCPANFYSAAGAPACTRCPIGSTSSAGSTSVSACITPAPTPAPTGCPAGQYQGTLSCTPCAKGTYNPLPNASSCAPCPTNTFVATTAAISCTNCPAGYISFVGSPSSESCYKSGITKCPDGFVISSISLRSGFALDYVKSITCTDNITYDIHVGNYAGGDIATVNGPFTSYTSGFWDQDDGNIVTGGLYFTSSSGNSPTYGYQSIISPSTKSCTTGLLSGLDVSLVNEGGSYFASLGSSAICYATAAPTASPTTTPAPSTANPTASPTAPLAASTTPSPTASCPCLNGGNCGSSTDTTCTCATGFYGVICESTLDFTGTLLVGSVTETTCMIAEGFWDLDEVGTISDRRLQSISQFTSGDQMNLNDFLLYDNWAPKCTSSNNWCDTKWIDGKYCSSAFTSWRIGLGHILRRHVSGRTNAIGSENFSDGNRLEFSFAAPHVWEFLCDTLKYYGSLDVTPDPKTPSSSTVFKFLDVSGSVATGRFALGYQVASDTTKREIRTFFPVSAGNTATDSSAYVCSS